MSYNEMLIGAKAFRHFMILSFCQIIEIMPNMVLKNQISNSMAFYRPRYHPFRTQCYETLYGFNLRIYVLGYSVCLCIVYSMQLSLESTQVKPFSGVTL
jgi:hypothetical protein